MNKVLEKIISTNFSKGLNLSKSHLINPEECQQSDNFLFDEGCATVRKGTVLTATLPYPIDAIKKYYKKDGTSYTAAFAGGRVYISYTAGTFVNVSCELLASGHISVTAYNDYIYFTNYSNVVKLFNGSSVDNAGLSSPAFVKFLGNFESTAGWAISGALASISADKTYLHIDRGEASLLFSAPSGEATFTNNTIFDLNNFATNASSDANDLIQFFTITEKKGNISSILLRFVQASGTTSGLYSECIITNLSSWTFCSNNSFATIHTVPKSLFTNNSNFTWTNAVAQVKIFPTSGLNATVNIDSLRMIKTPPLLKAQAISGGNIYFTPKPTPYYNPQTGEHTFSVPGVTLEQVKKWVSVSTDKIIGNIPEGEYFYKATFYKPGPGGIQIESNPCFQTSGILLSSTINTSTTISGAVTSSFSIDNHIAALSQIPIAPTNLGVTGRKIYRRAVLEDTMRHVATIVDNTTATFIDDVPIDAVTEVLDETRDVPPKAKYVYAASNQRTYYLNIEEDDGSHSSRIRFSQPYSPYYVPLDNVFEISPNDGSELTCMFELTSLQFFLKSSSLWMFDGINTNNIHPTYGCLAPKSLAVGPSEAFWLSDEGIIKYNLRVSNISLNDSRINTFLKDIPRTYLQNAAGVYYKGFYLLALSNGSNSTNNTVLCYDNARNEWTIFPNIQVNCWDVWGGGNDGYRLFYGNNEGQICEFFTSDTDFGVSIPWAIRTKDNGLPVPTVALREAFLYTKSEDGSGRTITATPYYDFVAGTAETVSATTGYSLGKIDVTAADDAGFISIGLSGTGRISILQLDIFGKKESVR